MVRGIQTAWSVPDNANTPTLYVSADLLNPKETFEVPFISTVTLSSRIFRAEWK